MSALTVGEMLDMMVADLDEPGGSFYGGRLVLSRWLREAYSNLWAEVVARDEKGDWTGTKSSAIYTANAEAKALTTWSPLGPPSRIYALWTAAGAKIPFIEAQDLPDVRAEGAFTRVAFILGDDLFLDPAPASNELLTMVYSPPAVKLRSGETGDTSPSPPGAGLWPAYTPRFPSDHYEAIPAYAVVLAEMAEAKPSREHQARSDLLQRALFDTVAKRRQNQTLPGVRVANPHDYRG
jgi:hypothetical protein